MSGPDPHFHKTISESFYVLTGTVRFHDGTGWTDGHPATSCTCRRVASTGSATSRGEPASMLLHFAPGAPREPYFETLKAVGDGLRMTPEEREAFMFAHDTFWL